MPLLPSLQLSLKLMPHSYMVLMATPLFMVMDPMDMVTQLSHMGPMAMDT